MESVEHLKNEMRSRFTDIDPAAEDFAGGVENNQFYVIAFAGVSDAAGDFAKHRFVEKIVFRTAEGHPCDAAVDAELHVLKFLRLPPFRLRDKFFGVDG